MYFCKISTFAFFSTLLAISFSNSKAANIDIDWIIPAEPYENIDVMVGDTATFTYSTTSPPHNVYIYPSGTCDAADKEFVGDQGLDVYTFTDDDVGEKTFACDISGHCDLGQIVTFVVSPFVCQLCDDGAAFENPTEIVVIPGVEDTLAAVGISEVQCQMLVSVTGGLTVDQCIQLKTLARPPCFCPGDNTEPVYVPCPGCSEPYTNPDSLIPELSNDLISATCGDIYEFNQENPLTEEQCTFTAQPIESNCVCEAPTNSSGESLAPTSSTSSSPTSSTSSPTSAPTSSSSVISSVFGVAGVLFGTLIMMA